MKAITLLGGGGSINIWQFETTADHSCVTRLSTGYDDRSTARSSDKNVYLNMRPRLVEQLGMIERLKHSNDLVTLI
jgi:hypothetical protein